MSSSTSPAATGNRLLAISESDHRGVVWNVSILCLIYTLLVVTVRTQTKYRIFGLDDWIATAAAVGNFLVST